MRTRGRHWDNFLENLGPKDPCFYKQLDLKPKGFSLRYLGTKTEALEFHSWEREARITDALLPQSHTIQGGKEVGCAGVSCCPWC